MDPSLNNITQKTQTSPLKSPGFQQTQKAGPQAGGAQTMPAPIEKDRGSSSVDPNAAMRNTGRLPQIDGQGIPDVKRDSLDALRRGTASLGQSTQELNRLVQQIALLAAAARVEADLAAQNALDIAQKAAEWDHLGDLERAMLVCRMATEELALAAQASQPSAQSVLLAAGAAFALAGLAADRWSEKREAAEHEERIASLLAKAQDEDVLEAERLQAAAEKSARLAEEVARVVTMTVLKTPQS